jgi:acyl dehydratase/NAD(P)-dependent dehydrogenase (short-subunit alcohol dehydrogenase family)
MTVSALSSRRFTLEGQLEFAEISGDWNPLHVDPIAARRTIYGGVVVHGIHSLFWALECVAQIAGEKLGLSHLKTEFRRQMHLDDAIFCKVLRLDDRNFKVCLEAKGKVLVRIEGSFSQSGYDLPDLPKKASGTDCRDLNFEEIGAAAGSLPLFVDEDRFGKLFPGVFRLLPCVQIAELLATTRLVGMECPGRHSIYLGHNLHFNDEHTKGSDELYYEVTRTDGRFSMLWLNVTGPAMRGTITAFARPRPRTQAAVEVVRGLVTQDEFIKSRALVIGGSRGLGEITAKIIAAGGGDVRITYNQGREDAERVTREIQSAGFKCSCLRFDATASEELAGQFETAWRPNQLYYFATAPISLETGDWFSPEKFHTYCRFYVNAFSSTVDSVRRLGGKDLSVFYPSTIFLEQFQEHSTEYCAAKAAGELLCRHLEQLFPTVRVYAPRLKRMTTDQTAGLLPIDAEDSLLGMLGAIREMPVPP